MKTIFKIHPFFYLFCLICIFTGYFKNFIYITLIILVHETGHILASIYYKWKIDKIVVLPFGGIILFDEKINRSLKEEFVITIMGPIFQIPLLFIKDDLFHSYNLFLLLFNLIPILPLDGSKLVNIFFNKIFSFKLSHILSIILSFIMLILMFFKRNLIIYISLAFLLAKTITSIYEHKYLFHKFLFERYLYYFPFKKAIIIKDKSQMKRDYKHLFKVKNKYIKESIILSNLFDI